ncbi:MAG TPA: leucyl aminopeptidase family protein [Oligoflexus sp.]|uniref:M17 family metallopeptidase n=1 Tax=Oligoflexus sp. TaxID=1971216 RepID=UPI002D4F7FE7|nr:leucyl aminopeptidase family protein [Oligoflexus sp.]HYX31852.1 leucyl aminopeptidase family protein [Oligoflexus sp.]
MHLRFLNSTKQILPKKGAVFMIGSLKAFQNKLHEKILPPEVADLFREALKTPRLGRTPISFSTLTGLAGPSKVVMGILPEKVAKDNSPTRREWFFQQLDAIESEEHSLVVLYLDRPEHYGSVATAVARRLRIVNRRKNAKPRTIHVLALDQKGQVVIADERVRSLSEQVAWACQVVDMPPNELTPDAFSDEIKDKFRSIPGCTFREILGPRLRTEGLHGIHAVGKGAAEPPRMIILDYKPKSSKKTVVLAGKGVTFDTGGLTLKPGASMVGMKGDMGGAAAVLGAFHHLILNKCPHRVIACVGLVENAIGPHSFRNDDVITMHSGKTVEVNNTDAEGRIVLADCLSYCARKYKPDLIIDAATLTGAQMVATGMLHAGVVSNREDLEQLAKRVGLETGDMVVPLPFAPELYQNEFKSQIADMVNSVKNRSNAQPSCAAQFIYSHVDDLDIPWLHIDMAGPSNTLSGLGTGYGIQLITRLTQEYV